MTPKDVVQIRQHEVLHDALATVSDPPINRPGPIDFWIYAEVLEVLGDGSVRVRVNHPGNREHGAEQIVAPADVRSKADVAALAGQKQHDNAGWNAKLQQHFATQAEKLVTQ